MSSMLYARSNTFQRSLALAAGIAGIFGLGYAFYFDHKRRSDPEYKQRIRENRKAKQASHLVVENVEFPDPRDAEENSRFFMEQFSMAEELMQMQVLPEEQFMVLAEALPAAAKRHTCAMQRYATIKNAHMDEGSAAAYHDGPQIEVLDDDLE
uniref:Mitochondrial import receptor subunit TOM20 n=1 Tax=Ditylenchus dipsaci TaxID=166011 RepID=A0A915DI05_9BILA